MTYRPNDLDSAISVQTTDSRGPLSLTVNDDRSPDELEKIKNEIKNIKNMQNHVTVSTNISDEDEKYAGSPTRL